MTSLVKALTPFLADQNKINDLIAPPYDIVNYEQVQSYLAQKPQSIMNVTRPDGLFEKSDAAEIIQMGYQAALKILNEKKSADYLLHQKKCFLIYQIQGDNVLQTGLLCLANSKDLKKHELTRKAKVEDRIALTDTLQCQISPVMLCTKADVQLGEHLTQLITHKSPYFDVEYQHHNHRLFLIDNDYEVKKIETFFTSNINIYITDGHHRSQTQLTRHEKNPQKIGPHVLSVIFPGETLNILGYHRVVQLPQSCNVAQFWHAVEKYFEVKPLAHGLLPSIDSSFGCCVEGKWFQLDFHQQNSSELAIDILHKNLIEPFFNVTNPKEDPNIDFIGGLNAITEIESFCVKNPNWIGFTIAPTTVNEIIKTADKNAIMPPKSTYFEPKLLDGFVLQDEN